MAPSPPCFHWLRLLQLLLLPPVSAFAGFSPCGDKEFTAARICSCWYSMAATRAAMSLRVASNLPYGMRQDGQETQVKNARGRGIVVAMHPQHIFTRRAHLTSDTEDIRGCVSCAKVNERRTLTRLRGLVHLLGDMRGVDSGEKLARVGSCSRGVPGGAVRCVLLEVHGCTVPRCSLPRHGSASHPCATLPPLADLS